MLKHISTLGLLAAAALGFVALPASADTAVIQQGMQDIYIQGSGNATVQRSQQASEINRQSLAGQRVEATGVVQDIYQTGTIVGDDNAVYQESRQTNVIRERVQPNNTRGQGRGRGARIEMHK